MDRKGGYMSINRHKYKDIIEQMNLSRHMETACPLGFSTEKTKAAIAGAVNKIDNKSN